MSSVCGPVTLVQIRGRDVGLTLTADRATILQDEPLYLEFRVELIAGPALFLLEGGDYRNHLGRSETYRVTATDARGHTLPVREPGDQFGGLHAARSVTEAKPFRKRLLLPLWVRRFPAERRYTIAVDKTLRVADAHDTRRPDAEVRVRVTLPLEVRASSFERLGPIIDELAARMLSSDHFAWEQTESALETIEDERVVAHYVKLLELGGDRAHVASHRLCRFATDAAVDALARALASPDLRSYELLSELGSNAHPRALELLWSFRNAEESNLRLAVLQGVVRNRPPDCVARVRSFLDDPDPDVVGEARVLLDELGESR